MPPPIRWLLVPNSKIDGRGKRMYMKNGIDQISDDYPHVMHVIQGSRSSYGDDMGAFLCFMAVRLIAMRRILKTYRDDIPSLRPDSWALLVRTHGRYFRA